MDAEQIRAAAAKQFSEENNALLKVDVPEWGEGAAIYYRPRLTVREVEQIAPRMDVNIVTMNLTTFILCARDSEGKRIYSSAATESLRSGSLAIDPRVLTRIVYEMGYFRDKDLEADAKKH